MKLPLDKAKKLKIPVPKLSVPRLGRGKKDQTMGRQRLVVSNTPRTQVFSYYASQRQAQTTKPGRRGARGSATPFNRNADESSTEPFNWRRIPTIAAIAIIALCMLVSTTLSGTPKVHVRLTGTTEQTTMYRPMDSYQKIVTEALGRSIFNKSKLSVQRDAIAASIRARLPEVVDVKLATPLISRNLIVTIETNAPAMLVQTTAGTFVVDTTGTVITTIAQAPAAAAKNLPTITDLADPQITLGKPLFSAQEVSFVVSLYKELTALKLETTKVTLPNGIANELHVTFKDAAYYVKFAMNGDARIQAGTYVAVTNNLAKQGTAPGEYIDVRVEGRAYYK